LVNLIIYISVLLHIVAAVFAVSLVKKTKYNASWILISAGFGMIAVYRSIDLFPILIEEKGELIILIQKWLGLLISLVLVVGVFYIRKIFKFLRDLDLIRDRSENKVLSAIIRTEENERKRFAKDVHDGLGPLLSVIKMLVSGIKDTNTSDVNTKIVKNTRQVVDEAIETIREISTNLSPHTLNSFGLKVALESFINKLKLVKDIEVRFVSNIGKERFNYNVEVIMYRIVCELINNTLKHADARIININILKESSVLKLEYSDDGKGFVEELSVINNNGMGLDNMINRLKSVKGDIRIESTPGEGMSAYVLMNLISK